MLLGDPRHERVRSEEGTPAPTHSNRPFEQSTVMTDLILGLDPVDTPISDYEGFGIRTGAADLDRAPRIPRHAPRPPLAAGLARVPGHPELA